MLAFDLWHGGCVILGGLTLCVQAEAKTRKDTQRGPGRQTAVGASADPLNGDI